MAVPSDKPEKRAEKRTEKRERAHEHTTRRAPSARLDTPADPRRALPWRRSHEEDRFGVFAERFARFMGTAKFLIWMTVVVVVWIAWDTLLPKDLQFDKYPFIFLTLMLSLQASYAAPLILLAQNRQEQRDRVVAEQDRQADAASHADMEFLAREVASLRMALGEVATRDYLRSELRALLTDLEERAQDAEDAPEDERPEDAARDGAVDGPVDGAGDGGRTVDGDGGTPYPGT